MKVPPSPRAAGSGVVALTPHVVASAYVLAVADNLLVPAALDQLTRADIAYGNFLNTVAWSGIAVAISTVGSGVIFGLRAEADKVRRLGQYTLEEKIGEGGMGSVYRASHAMLRRPRWPRLSPDGSKVAVIIDPRPSEVWVYDLERNTRSLLYDSLHVVTTR